jgi:hypothetical protein
MKDVRGRKTAVVIDLKRHAGLWEDIYDALVARRRAHEPRESFGCGFSQAQGCAVVTSIGGMSYDFLPCEAASAGLAAAPDIRISCLEKRR